MLMSLLALLTARAEPPADVPAERPRIGLALSGGGPLGLAHIGVLRALEELGVPVDAIAGTSMGGLMGGLYATGLSPEALLSLTLEQDWPRNFSDQSDRIDTSMRRKEDDYIHLSHLTVGFSELTPTLPLGLLEGQRLSLLMRRLTLPVNEVHDFSTLRIPFRCVATDVHTGEAVALSEGDLAVALRATMSAPVAFAPVLIDGRELIDGGLSNNLPIDQARALGADVVIAVKANTPFEDVPSTNLLRLFGRSFLALMEQHTLDQIATLTDQDLLIIPSVTLADSSFDKAEHLEQLGYEATMAVADALAPYRLSEADYAAWRAEHAPPPPATVPVISAIELDNRSRLSDRTVRGYFDRHLDAPLDIDRLERDIARLYGIGGLGSVSYSLPQPDTLRIQAHAKSWGPSYLSLGVRLEDDFVGDAPYEIRLTHRLLLWNALGGEWHNSVQLGADRLLTTELIQPVTTSLRTFFSLRGERDAFIDLLGEEIVRTAGELRAGQDIGRIIELSAGYGVSRAAVTAAEVTTTSATGAVLLGLRVDSMDDAFFPTQGFFLRADASTLQTTLSTLEPEDDLDYDAASRLALSAGRLTLSLAGEAAGVFGAEGENLSSQHDLGGLFRLSGMPTGSLRATHLLLTRAGLRYRVAGQNEGPVQLPVYLGVTAEAGDAFDRYALLTPIYAGSLYLGSRTGLGPLYLAYGQTVATSPPERTLTFSLGHVIQ